MIFSEKKISDILARVLLLKKILCFRENYTCNFVGDNMWTYLTSLPIKV